MKASVYHIQLNVSNPEVSFPFYKDLLKIFDYKIAYEDKEVVGFSNGTTDFWIQAAEKDYKENKFHRKNTGINHIAFKVEARQDVEKFYEKFLKPRKIPILYSTPREFPEYEKGYFAVFFEDPDRIKLEVVHLPHAPKS